MRFLVISGRSGSGKSSALHLLEDEGFTCIDNLPASLFPALVKQVKRGMHDDKLQFAVGIDARNLDSDLANFPEILRTANLSENELKVLYLDATKDVLIKRFSETRRRHPLSGENMNLSEAITKEQDILAPMASLANIIIDTSSLNLHQLRSTVKQQIIGVDTKGMAISITSFGFKFGVPIGADFMFDVRCLPNPHWEASLRGKTGLEKEVIEFLEKQEQVQEMYGDIEGFITKWVPSFEQNNRSYLTVAIGCTGGMHRSVYLAERLAKQLKEVAPNVNIQHRQLSQTPIN
ncbi:MAG: RNase adapter RapZ [Alteromonadaceae bacterium]|nr:MAG: RNase adapter RapZ [Alteromonadaceae bacterium]